MTTRKATHKRELTNCLCNSLVVATKRGRALKTARARRPTPTTTTWRTAAKHPTATTKMTTAMATKRKRKRKSLTSRLHQRHRVQHVLERRRQELQSAVADAVQDARQ